MKIALHDADKTGFPNLALMKLSAWHKAQGHEVEMFKPLFKAQYDHIYSSKVFTFTPEDEYLPASADKHGIGRGDMGALPDAVEHICPDYALYGSTHAQGFVTRGCPNRCSWCIVPKKEGAIVDHADVEEFTGGMKEVVLMDNNILASEHGVKQLEKISRLGLKLDCNQGLDARLVDEPMANVLGSIKWTRLRFACDQKGQMPAVERAVKLYRAAAKKKGNIFCYVLVKDVEDALDRVEFLRGLGVDPFAQPYRDFVNNIGPTQEQKNFSRWVNHKAIFKSVPWSKYRGTK
jgi:hypothetical protein